MKPTRPSHRTLSGWVVPLAYSALALALAMTLPRLENRYLSDWVSTLSAPAAMAFCSAIASGMIAMTGIVFSLTFVMVQFSATAYSPRLVLWVARDPVMSHALGVFNATFLYALGLLAWTDREGSGRVPALSAWLVLLLLLASVAMFIALIQRVEMLQINRMLVFTGDQGRHAIAEFYPLRGEPPASGTAPDLSQIKPIQTIAHVGRPQSVQRVDVDALLQLSSVSDAVIEVVASVADRQGIGLGQESGSASPQNLSPQAPSTHAEPRPITTP